MTQLRTIVAAMDREMLQTPPDATLRTTWAELVQVLALEPAPQTRVCPSCHGVGMRAASRCGNCWATLEPLPPMTEPPVAEQAKPAATTTDQGGS